MIDSGWLFLSAVAISTFVVVLPGPLTSNIGIHFITKESSRENVSNLFLGVRRLCSFECPRPRASIPHLGVGRR